MGNEEQGNADVAAEAAKLDAELAAQETGQQADSGSPAADDKGEVKTGEVKTEDLGDLDEIETEAPPKEEKKADEFDAEKVNTKSWSKEAKEAFTKMTHREKEYKTKIADLEKKSGAVPEEVTKELTELRALRSVVDIQKDPQFIKDYNQPVIDAATEIVSTLTSLGVPQKDAITTLKMTAKDRMAFVKEKTGPEGLSAIIPMFAKRDRLADNRIAAIQKAESEKPKLDERRKASEEAAVAAALEGVHAEVAKDISFMRLTGGVNPKWDARVAQRLVEAKKLAVASDPRERTKVAIKAAALDDALRIIALRDEQLKKLGHKITRKVTGRASLGGNGSGTQKTGKAAAVDKVGAMSIVDIAHAVGDGLLD